MYGERERERDIKREREMYYIYLSICIYNYMYIYIHIRFGSVLLTAPLGVSFAVSRQRDFISETWHMLHLG